MVDGDALEMRLGEILRGFESPPLRFIKDFNCFSKCGTKLNLLSVGQASQ